MRSESVTMDRFLSDVQQDLQESLSRMYPQVRVEQRDVAKLQGESYRGLAVQMEGHAATPVFRIDSFFQQMDMWPYEAVMKDIVQKVVETIENPMMAVPEEFMNYDVMKEKLMTQVVGTKDNAARLAELPHGHRHEGVGDQPFPFGVQHGRECGGIIHHPGSGGKRDHRGRRGRQRRRGCGELHPGQH